MSMHKSDAANHSSMAREVLAHEDITHQSLATATNGRQEDTKASVAAGAAQRSAADTAAVRSGILPPKPELFDSSNPTPPKETPVSSKDDFSKKFDGMKPGETRYDDQGRAYRYDVDAAGNQTRSVEDAGKHTSQTEVVRADGSTDLTVGAKGSLETTKWDSSGQLRSDELNKSATPDGKFNYSDKRNWYKGQQLGDLQRWQDSSGTFHESQTMKLDDGSSIVRKMDGDRTDTKTTNADGSWTDEVKQMNVDKVDPATQRHYKTMTIDRTEGKN